ncbi:MAG: PSD1 domain-containing protein [Acidobacteria bacterium]|nr:PSD1 domain-containing protein [Acidobacteriota bacterium]
MDKKRRFRIWLAGPAALAVSLAGAVAQAPEAPPNLPPAVRTPVDFARDVAPIFQKNCYGCHGPAQQMNGLRLDQKEAALKGGNSGPVILPGSSEQSKLILRVSSTQSGFRMPAIGAPLTPAEIGILRAWIDQEASWGAGSVAAAASSPPARQPALGHWSFQPIRLPVQPAVRHQERVRNPIDAFVVARLEAEGIEPSPEADKVTLLRRLSFDLTGLPPTLQEVRDFLEDKSPNAYERAVDRLLQSPHYGEKWARQWLDLARYADSDGYEKDLSRPYAWRWRQWVIEALNRDMPFDQFTVAQIAGDLLPGATVEQKVATGFHRNSLKNREAGVNRQEARFEEVIDRTNTTGTVWLGLTVGCAQCHDHKFDPIAQKDYYRLFAFFNSAEEADIDAPLPGEMGPYLRARPQYEAKRRALLEENDIPDLQAKWEAKIVEAMDNPGKSLDWDFSVTSLRAMLDHADRLLRKGPEKRTPKENERVTEYFVADPGPEVAKDKPTLEMIRKVREQLKELNRTFPALTQANAIAESPEPVKTYVAVRGDYRQKGLEVQPGTLSFLPPMPVTGEPPRLRLARWLVSRENPLTARVVVNRMWQEFFGAGLVRTSEDFGTQGERSTHPELLDLLASTFMDRGWSMKQMHRLIVTSSTYRQSSRTREDLKDKDPDNRLLARQSRLRLPAEEVRDAALAASGLLYPAVGGKSVRPAQPESVSKLTYANGAPWEETEGPERYRRGLYVHYQRTSPYPQLVNFDEPDSVTSCTRRRRSNTPLQALNLLNDPVFVEAAQALAVRVLEEAPANWNDRLEHAFQLCLSRKPDASEKARLAKFFEQQEKIFEKARDSARLATPNAAPGVAPAETASLVMVSRALMNVDEFITRE